MNIFNQ